MTDINQDSNLDQNSTPAPSVSHETQATQEKMVPQSRVDHYVQDGWHRGYQKAKSELEKQQQEQKPVQQQQQSYSPDDLDARLEAKLHEKLKAIQDAEAKKQYDSQMQSLANDFAQKINSSKEKYADFDQKVGQIGYESISHLIPAINGMENPADIVYALADNPSRIGSITTLAQINPNLAIVELQRLSQSIKRNEDAKNQRYPEEPLSPLSHSNTGKDSGSNSISDLKRADWLRG